MDGVSTHNQIYEIRSEISDVISKTRNMRYGFGVETVRDSTTLAAFEFPFVETRNLSDLSVRYSCCLDRSGPLDPALRSGLALSAPRARSRLRHVTMPVAPQVWQNAQIRLKYTVVRAVNAFVTVH